MASSNVIIRKCEGQGINVQDLNGLTYSGTRQDFMISGRCMYITVSSNFVFISNFNRLQHHRNISTNIIENEGHR